MSDGPPGLHQRLLALVAPSGGDVLRAKRALLARLSAGAGVASVELVRVLAVEEGVGAERQSQERLDVPVGSDVGAVENSSPLIARQRLIQAARVALAELADEGVIMRIDGPANEYISIPVQHGNRGYTERLEVPRPTLGSGYALSRRFQGDLVMLIDGDLFNADLEPLGLDVRARQCVHEAIEAYRRGLYLACVSLIGSVSEGAWWRLAEHFRGLNADLDAALDNDRTSAAYLIRLVADLIGGLRGKATIAAELHAHATYLRELRNYGIHPRAMDPVASHERAFTEAGCSLLLLETHRYLERLAEFMSA